MANPPRLLPNKPLPPYTYIPGKAPHPFSHPSGHGFGLKAEKATTPDKKNWASCQPYLHGFDLFNHGYFWEAHEAWESCWHAAGRQGSCADFLKGLIKLAAAGVKHLQGQPEGVLSHSCRAAQLWNYHFQFLEDEDGKVFGLEPSQLQSLAEEICRNGWPKDAIFLVPRMPE